MGVGLVNTDFQPWIPTVGMRCGGCANKVRRLLEDQDEVRQVIFPIHIFLGGRLAGLVPNGYACMI